MTQPSTNRVLGETALDLSDLLTEIRSCVERARTQRGLDGTRDELREIERIVNRASLLTGRVLAISRTSRIIDPADVPASTEGDEDPSRDNAGDASSAIV